LFAALNNFSPFTDCFKRDFCLSFQCRNESGAVDGYTVVFGRRLTPRVRSEQ
jgi:hypothetical protein